AACGACAACDGFGFSRNTATTFDVFYWLQVTNFDVLLNSAPSGLDYIDILGLCLHAPPNYFVATFALGWPTRKHFDCVANCVADCIRLGIPQATERERLAD